MKSFVTLTIFVIKRLTNWILFIFCYWWQDLHFPILNIRVRIALPTHKPRSLLPPPLLQLDVVPTPLLIVALLRFLLPDLLVQIHHLLPFLRVTLARTSSIHLINVLQFSSLLLSLLDHPPQPQVLLFFISNISLYYSTSWKAKIINSMDIDYQCWLASMVVLHTRARILLHQAMFVLHTVTTVPPFSALHRHPQLHTSLALAIPITMVLGLTVAQLVTVTQ